MRRARRDEAAAARAARALGIAALAFLAGLGLTSGTWEGAPVPGSPTSGYAGDQTGGTEGPSMDRAEVRLPGPVSAGSVDPDNYRVGPGDMFLIQISGRTSRTQYITIGPEGSMYVPGAGVVKLDGLTLREARLRLERLILTQTTGLQIDVSLAQVRMLRVHLVGDVKQPGPLDLLATSHVSDAVASRELLEGASTRNVEVRHRDGTSVIADIELFFRTGRTELNPYLRDGDIIRVVTARRFVEIEGAVARPGRFELGPTDSLKTLLDLAGGLLPSARRDDGLFVRFLSAVAAESVSVSLDDIARGVVNPDLRDGDHFYVYYVPRYHELYQATILGEVHNPGTYPLRTGVTRLSDLVRAAGGFLEGADLSTLRIFRVGTSAAVNTGELERLSKLGRSEMTASEYEIFRANLSARREDFRVDWNRLQQSPELDLVLRAGDLVTVDRILASVRVEGEVRHPGLIAYDTKRTAEDYVRLAGGFSRRADHGQVRITRAVTGQNLLARDISEIAPGDMIWVPERPDKTLWEHLGTLIAVAAQVATVIIAVRR